MKQNHIKQKRVTIIWRTAMSMDGRIASHNESLDFLNVITDRKKALADFPKFLASVDAVLLGGNTLRWLIRQGHSWPHGDIPTWLISQDKSLMIQVGTTKAPFRRFAGDLRSLMKKLDASGFKRIWLCGGGNLAGQLLELDRIDEVDVTIAPTALGAGLGLFGDRPLELHTFIPINIKQSGNAIVIKWMRDKP